MTCQGKLLLIAACAGVWVYRYAVRGGPPLYGEHTAEVLAEYGFSAAEIEALYPPTPLLSSPLAGIIDRSNTLRNSHTK